ncbi:non-ribosomal peptide synthetase [Oceanicella sp. SM1341]|uniref:non-ribosomal peptide synthetase n=1 Tax=Oceanicella sp. SM1341 TaxID=1548889 RepID=UPI000E471A38|nr:non-ribosomal peptide synthetase [Oceanicella sp. SM1341]
MADTLDALRARVAALGPAQRDALRRQLAERGIDWERVAPPEPAVPLPEGPLPLGPSQQHFWVQQQLHPESSAYNIAFTWTMRGRLDRPALEQALQALVDRHEPLRTGFPAEAGVPCQQVAPACTFTLGRSRLDGAEALEAAAGAFAARPFDLATPPLMRAHLFTLGEAEHALTLCLHHIVADGWSRGVLMRELAALYTAFRAGEAPDLAPLATSYGALVRAAEARAGGAEIARQRRYWQDALAGLAPQELPADRPRGAGTDHRAATLLHPLPADLCAGLERFAAGQGASAFTVLLAAFKLLLHRETGATDLALGVPVAGRRGPEAEGLIGLFVNTLVLRAQVDPAEPFTAWLTRLRGRLADALEHQDIPFLRVVEALGLARDGGQNPFFQVMFQAQTGAYRAQNAETVALPGLEVSQALTPLAHAKFDLSVFVMDRGGALEVAFEYRTALFEPARIARLARQYEQILRAVIASPEAPLRALDHLGAEARAALRAVPQPPALPARSVPELLEAAAARAPEAVALEWEGGALTAAGLQAAAEALARHLAARPELSRPGARVAVCLPRGPGLVTALIAILKAGAVYVPVDPSHPEARRNHILADADVALVLAEAPVPGCERPHLDPRSLGPAPDAALPAPDAERPAYLLYTSGSTGAPKGAVIRHSGLVNQLAGFTERLGMGPGHRMLALTTIGFDISILEMLLPLAAGATVVMGREGLLLEPARLAELIGRARITHLQATPASWRLLLDAGWQGSAGLTALCGGEPLDPGLGHRLLALTGALWNLYGPTETTIWSSALRLGPEHLEPGGARVGGPLPGVGFHVLDAHLDPVPEGVPGELYITGIGLGDGYWRRPALTAATFLPDPFADAPGARLYRSGDIVSRRGETYAFHGRADHQVKLRGYRIETGEIEARIAAHPGIAQALVLLDREHERLVAWCRTEGAPERNKPTEGAPDKHSEGAHSETTEGAPHKPTEPTPPQPTGSAPSGLAEIAPVAPLPQTTAREDLLRGLRTALAEALPRYMVPSAFVLVERFALNTNGKIDRARLPQPAPPAAAGASRPAEGEAETCLLAIWRGVLGREDIGVEDNFFDLGGDSVTAMQIAARAGAQGLKLTPQQLFEHQSVAAQALVARPVEAEAPLPPSVWQAATPPPPPARALLPLAPLPEGVMAEALRRVTARHPALRLRRGAGGWLPGGTAPAPDTPTAGAEAWRAEVTGGPSPQLVVTARDGVLDAPSLARLAGEIAATARALAEGVEPEPSPAGDYPAWLRAPGPAPELAPGLSDEPVSAPGPAAPTETGLEAAAVLAAAKAFDAPPEALLATALLQVFAQWRPGESPRLDVLTSRAPGPGFGNFTRLVPLAPRLPQGAAPGKVAAVLRALEAGGAGQGIAPAGGFAVMAWEEDPAPCRLEGAAPPLPPGYALGLAARCAEGRLRLSWSHDPARLSAATLARLAARCTAALEALRPPAGTAAPDRKDRLLDQLRQRGG